MGVAELRKVFKEQLLEDFAGKDDLECLNVIAYQAPESFTPSEREKLEEELWKLVNTYVSDGGFTDRDMLEEMAGTVTEIGESLNMRCGHLSSQLDERCEEIKKKLEERADGDYDSWRDARLEAESEEQVIDSMFDVFADDEPGQNPVVDPGGEQDD